MDDVRAALRYDDAQQGCNLQVLMQQPRQTEWHTGCCCYFLHSYSVQEVVFVVMVPIVLNVGHSLKKPGERERNMSVRKFQVWQPASHMTGS